MLNDPLLSAWLLADLMGWKMRNLVVICAAIAANLLCASADVRAVESQDIVLVRVVTKSGASHVGELVRNDKAVVALRHLDSGVTDEFDKTVLATIEHPLGEAKAAQYVGLPTLMAWKIGGLPKETSVIGKIARITPSVIYLNVGEASGFESGQELTVYREGEEVLDPDTKEVLTKERHKLAKIRVVEVARTYSKARMVGDLEVPLKIGDQVESSPEKLLIAVLPVEDDSENEAGAVLTEQLTTSLTNKEIPVVERALLDKVLGEQFLQHSFLFDEKTAQRLGKQLGATAILTGRIVGRGEAHVRLIDVKSGRILLAASARLATARPTSSEPTAKSQNVDSRTGRGQVKAAGDKILPGFFLTRDAALVMREGLVIRGDSVLRSRTGDFIDRDFVFEIVYEFGKLTAAGERDHSVHVGIGDDSLEDGHPQKCVGLDIRPTTINSEGRITLLTRSDGRRGAKEDLFGLIRKSGPHRLKIEKSNAMLTFRLDVDNDGETVDDLEMTIPDLREFAPFLHEKNSYLYIGGGGVFTNGRLSFDGVGSRINAKSLRAGHDDRMYPLRRGEPWPEFLQAGDNAVIAKDGLEVRAHAYVATKRADLVERNFAFEVELVFPTWTERSTMDQIAYVGIGEPNSNQSPDPCVCMSIRPPEINDGHVDVARSAEGTPYRGGEMKVTNLRGRGPHIVRIEKKGNTVTFALDVDADGKDAADATVTIPDIAEYAPFLHRKNSHIIFGGGARFTSVRFAVEN